MEADPIERNGFDHMEDDIGGDLDNPFGGDDNLGNMDFMQQHSRNSKTERNLLEPAMSKNESLMQQSDSIFGQQKPVLKNSLSELLPSMAEPDAEDSD